jgi:ribosomal protein S18 acetylase RimI-like enzyme
MMNEIQIQKITLDHLAQLQEIGRKTFAETFSSTNSEENMALYLKEGFAAEKLTAELQNPESEFYFAAQNEKVIGYLKVNFGQAQTESQKDNTLEIERIYVLADYHGKKVGQLLYDKAIEVAKQKKFTTVWLGVWEENKKAIQFYTKNGFVAFDQHIFKLGDDEQTDIMMRLEINE